MKPMPKLLSGAVPLAALLGGLVALYVAERALHDLARYVVLGLGALVVGSAVLAVLRINATEGDRRQAYKGLAIEYGVAVLAVALYFAGSLEWLPEGKVAAVAQVVWPALLVLALVPIVAMEMALFSMEAAPKVELWRVRFASRSARIVALAVIAFAGVNFTAAAWNRKIDLSYFKTTAAGTATLSIMKNLTKPLRFVLFFPTGNEVLEHVKDYVGSLARESDKVTVEIYDQALEPELARKLKVRNNGYLALLHEEKSESIKLDIDLEDARATLRELDAKVQEKLLRVLKPPRVAYFTTGHLERDYAPLGDDKRYGMADLRSLCESLGFTVKRLGLGEGLGSKVPDDAALVIVAGAIEPFLAEEKNSLQAYLDKGGRLLLLVDPDHGSTADDLTAMVGVKVSKALAAHERYLVRVEGRGESPYYLATNRAATHPSVLTLSRAGERLGVVLLGAGALTKLDKLPPEMKVTFTLRSMPDTWLDDNGNRVFDKATEKRGAPLDFGAAVERTIAAPAEEGEAAEKEAGKKDQPLMRAMVLGDADVAGDGIVRNQGNAYLFADGVRWLAGEEENAGTVESEKDVPIVHKKEEDTILFYGTSFLMPAVVLGAGLLVSRRRRPARKEVAS
ncbi:MAG: Gldg family protein [Deltaproteobacteria bacterium]|nr:Gldg family protein [Deltaproteobacteria bacterium]